MRKKNTLTSRKRLAILGLDGLPFTLARSLSIKGITPNLARLALTSQALPIAAELPELSPVNWTSFCLACGPEEHGIFGFVRIDPATYQIFPSDFSQAKGQTIFARLSQKGLLSKVINMPALAPVRTHKGIMVAGFPASSLQDAVHPPPLRAILKSRGYKIEADTSQGATNPAHLLAQLEATLNIRKDILGLLWPDLAWDIFTLVLTETDRIGHFLFPALEDQTHPWHTDCLALLQKWDELIGLFLDMYDALPEPKRLIALADHGFCTLQREVDLNCWLRQKNWLRTVPGKYELDFCGIDEQTTAFALDPGRIYIHSRARFAHGRLSETDTRHLREEIKAGLQELRWQGQPVIRKIFTREELYPGPCQKIAPDLVCVPYNGFDLKAKFNRTEIFGLFGRQGMHTADNVFFYDSLGASPRRLREVGQEVLRMFLSRDFFSR